ncbi:MAG: amino acid aminotransferase [Lautropia sp.]|nr:amino acid aminotransferase [Lautropia sp.]
MASSLFSSVPLAPRDPILGITEAFNADTRSTKANLGVGVYYDENGKLPLLSCVRQAEDRLVAAHSPRGYLPIDGIAPYDQAVQKLLFGEGAAVIAEKRAITAQALGGTGALKIGADLLKRFSPAGTTVYISDPSWENHRALFEAAGFEVKTYPYYDAATHGVNFQGMLDCIKSANAGSIFILHACCHNPTGVDLDGAQWDQVIAALTAAGHVPFLDIAYQGFGDGIPEDGEVIRKFAAGSLPFLVSSSFSKSFSLYGERVGALTVVLSSADEAARTLSQLKRVIRSNYSNPPTHGGQVVQMVLNDADLRKLWEEELGAMRVRIKKMRKALVDGLKAAGIERDFSFIEKQRGMFSYSGLTADQVELLKADHGIYAVSSGRICVAALNDNNVERIARAVAEVLKKA